MNKKLSIHMAISNVSPKNKYILWGKSAGRCQYRGCNEYLGIDDATKAEFNIAYIAHIVASSINGPRGHATRSAPLEDDLENLMLLCDKHHRLIDKEQVEEHSEEVLLQMKRSHENRIDLVSDINSDLESQIVIFGANIGTQPALISDRDAREAIIPKHYPAKDSIIIGMINSEVVDSDPGYWAAECLNLERKFEKQVRPLLQVGERTHFSFFGIAPQALLIKAGSLLCDIQLIDVYQRQREHLPLWSWPEKDLINFVVDKPKLRKANVALVLSISGTISEERISQVLGDDVSMWKISVDRPHNDVMRSTDMLKAFRTTMRKLYDDIKSFHGEDAVIHVFPAMPVSIAVELGRIRMPKADLPLKVYDQMTKKKVRKFHAVLDIV